MWKAALDMCMGMVAALVARQPASSLPKPQPSAPATPPVVSGGPPWIAVARGYMGLTEIAGARHEPRILAMWKRVRAAWFKTDEVPWCGAFVGNCLAEAGLPILPPSEVGRALAWARYGDKLTHARVGTIGVKRRKGGGHVFFVVGINAKQTHYAALGGNQSNAVSVVWIPKSEVVALRWPPRWPVPARGLPILKNLRNAGSEA